MKIPDNKSGFVEGIVLEEFIPGQQGRVQIVKTQTEAILLPAISKLVERRVESTQPSEAAPHDLSSLIHLSRASLLEALRLRHESNQVYTSVGPILVSVNPYRSVPQLYTPERQAAYFNLETSDPHIYETGVRAFLGATQNRQDQSVIFSGESGAGKTFATKLFTEFLVYASSRSDSRSAERALVQRDLQSAQPMIEAFGNARTSRNDNSSRFGCWTEIEFSGNEICGASVTGFNLEKSRVVSAASSAHDAGEHQRNFHIFYQICAAKPHLNGKTFRYLADSAPTNADRAQFNMTKQSMADLNVDELNVLQIVEGILELGNIEFLAEEDPVTGEERSVLADESKLERICTLLGGLDPIGLAKGLLMRDMSNPREEIFKPHSRTQAEEARDALAKHCYGRLFDWLLVRVNRATSKRNAGCNGGFPESMTAIPTTTTSTTTNDENFNETANQLQAESSANKTISAQQQGTIGLLDTYGFEIFATNSFEQLCINYCNERIMSAFNATCIQAEHALYSSEGLTRATTNVEPFLDRSKICIDLFEQVPGGIFAVLDDEIRIPKGCDAQFLRKLRDAQKKHQDFIPYVSEQREAKAKHIFGVNHFAGTVHYCVEEFLEKNRDTLHAQLIRVCTESKGFVGRELFATGLFSLSSSPRKKRQSRKVLDTSQQNQQNKKFNPTIASEKQSLGLRFRMQLDQLMTKIAVTQTHFVRCIKPNGGLSTSSEFQGSVVLEQLNYGGVLETCRLRKDGFQVRRSRGDFFDTYSRLCPLATTVEELAAELQRKYGISCEIGKTTAFLKADQFNRLERALADQTNVARITLQSFGRFVLEKRKHSDRKHFLNELTKATKALNEKQMEQLLIKAQSVFGSKYAEHVPQVQKAEQVLQWLREERRVCEDCRTIQAVVVATNGANGLQTFEQAILECERLNHDLTGNVARTALEARSILNDYKAIERKQTELQNEARRDAQASNALLIIQRAVKRFLYRHRVRAAFIELENALKSQDVDRCLRAVRRMSELGLRDHPKVQEAARMLPDRRTKKINKQGERSLKDLEEAVRVARLKSARVRDIKPEDVAALTMAINRARVDGCVEQELRDAVDLEREMLNAVAMNSSKSKKWWWCCTGCTGGNQGVRSNPTKIPKQLE